MYNEFEVSESGPLLAGSFGNPQQRHGSGNHFMRLLGETVCGKVIAGVRLWRKWGSGFYPSFFI